MSITATIKKSLNHIREWYASQPTSRLYTTGSIVLLLALGFGAIVTALGNALFFDGYPADGAFQLLNPMRRLMDGQVIGRDFSFFHGIGVPLLHLPFYVLFGQGIFGEEMTRWLVSPLLFIGSAFCVFYVWRRKFFYALNMSVFVTLLGMVVVPFLVLPLTSILGVRSVVPVFLLAVMLNQARLGRPVIPKAPRLFAAWTWYELLSGVLLAVGLLCGTEFGAAAVLAFVIARLAYPTTKGEAMGQRWLSLVRTISGFVVVLFALLTLVTWGHPLAPLTYAFIDIPADQVWYFGVPPNKFVHFGNLLPTLMGDWLMLLLLAGAVFAATLTYRVHRMRRFRAETQAFIYALLAGAFAMVSMLGYYNNSEAGALARMALIVSGVALTILSTRWKKPIVYGFELGSFKDRIKLTPPQAARRLGVAFIGIAVLYTIFQVVFLQSNFAVGEAFKRAISYVRGTNTEVLGSAWKNEAEALVPIIQSDNTVDIADTNDNGFTHGVKAGGNQLVVRAGEHASFIRPRQIVYFSKAGRQIIQQVSRQGDTQIITLQANVQLDPAKDGAPSKLIVSEDFKHDNTKVWSLYTGVLNEEMGVMNPSKGGYDYIIHALGEQRRADYVNDFKQTKSQYVMSFTRSFFAWEEWMQNSHWDLYSLIDQNYEVVHETPTYILWKRKDQPWSDTHAQSQPWQPLTLHAADGRIDLPKLSFDNVPDVEAYGQEIADKERDHLLYMGREIDARQQVTSDQYDQFILGRLHRQQNEDIFKRENNGPETESQQLQVDNVERSQARREKAAADKGIFSATNPELHIPRAKRQVIVVKLQYQLSSPLGAIPVIGKSTRYMAEPNNTYTGTGASLRPYANEVVFPLVISEDNSDSYIRLNTYSLFPGKGSVKILKAEWTPLDTSVANLKVLTD